MAPWAAPIGLLGGLGSAYLADRFARGREDAARDAAREVARDDFQRQVLLEIQEAIKQGALTLAHMMKGREGAEQEVFATLIELHGLIVRVFDDALRAELQDLSDKTNAARMAIGGGSPKGPEVDAYNSAMLILQPHIGDALRRLF